MQGNGIKNQPLGHELRIDVLVAEVLAHIETLLGEDIILNRSQPTCLGYWL